MTHFHIFLLILSVRIYITNQHVGDVNIWTLGLGIYLKEDCFFILFSVPEKYKGTKNTIYHNCMQLVWKIKTINYQ